MATIGVCVVQCADFGWRIFNLKENTGMPSLTKRNRFVMLLFLNMFNAVYMIYWYVSVLKELSFFRGKKFSGALAAVIIICTVFLALFYYDYKICNL